MRKEYGVFVDGKFELLVPEHPQVFAYTRTNETENTDVNVLMPYEARMYIKK